MQAQAPIEDELWEVQFAVGELRRMTLEQLDDAYRLGVVSEATLIREAGTSEWHSLGEVAGLDADEAANPSPTDGVREANAGESAAAAPNADATHAIAAPNAPLTSEPEPATTRGPTAPPGIEPEPATTRGLEVPALAARSAVAAATSGVGGLGVGGNSAPKAGMSAARATLSRSAQRSSASLNADATQSSDKTKATSAPRGTPSNATFSRLRPSESPSTAATSPRDVTAIKQAQTAKASAEGKPASDNTSAANKVTAQAKISTDSKATDAKATDSSTQSTLDLTPQSPSAAPALAAFGDASGEETPNAAEVKTPSPEVVRSESAPAQQAPSDSPPPESTNAGARAMIPSLPPNAFAHLFQATPPAPETPSTAIAAQPMIALTSNPHPAISSPASLATNQEAAGPEATSPEAIVTPTAPHGSHRLPNIAAPEPVALTATQPAEPAAPAIAELPENAPPVAPATGPTQSAPVYVDAQVAAIAGGFGMSQAHIPASPIASNQPQMAHYFPDPAAHRNATTPTAPAFIPDTSFDELAAMHRSSGLSKKEWAFWTSAAALCLMVVLQRNGMLHSLSKATGAEPKYLQMERSLLGAPDVATPRGLKAAETSSAEQREPQ